MSRLQVDTLVRRQTRGGSPSVLSNQSRRDQQVREMGAMLKHCKNAEETSKILKECTMILKAAYKEFDSLAKQQVFKNSICESTRRSMELANTIFGIVLYIKEHGQEDDFANAKEQVASNIGALSKELLKIADVMKEELVKYATRSDIVQGPTSKLCKQAEESVQNYTKDKANKNILNGSLIAGAGALGVGGALAIVFTGGLALIPCAVIGACSVLGGGVGGGVLISKGINEKNSVEAYEKEKKELKTANGALQQMLKRLEDMKQIVSQREYDRAVGLSTRGNETKVMTWRKDFFHIAQDFAFQATEFSISIRVTCKLDVYSATNPLTIADGYRQDSGSSSITPSAIMTRETASGRTDRPPLANVAPTTILPAIKEKLNSGRTDRLSLAPVAYEIKTPLSSTYALAFIIAAGFTFGKIIAGSALDGLRWIMLGMLILPFAAHLKEENLMSLFHKLKMA